MHSSPHNAVLATLALLYLFCSFVVTSPILPNLSSGDISKRDVHYIQTTTNLCNQKPMGLNSGHCMLSTFENEGHTSLYIFDGLCKLLGNTWPDHLIGNKQFYSLSSTLPRYVTVGTGTDGVGVQMWYNGKPYSPNKGECFDNSVVSNGGPLSGTKGTTCQILFDC